MLRPSEKCSRIVKGPGATQLLDDCFSLRKQRCLPIRFNDLATAFEHSFDQGEISGMRLSVG